MNTIECQEVTEILADKSATGRVRPWNVHKLNSGYISLAYEEVNPNKAERMKTCADWLAFAKGGDGKLKLHDARFCRVRLCPICQWRRSLKTYAQMSQILDCASRDGYQFIFLTLTVKNCKAPALSDELTHILLSFNRLMKYKDVQRAVKGFYRGLEVKHNIYTNEYHPHIHAILAVNKSYFKSKVYLSHEAWVKMWQRALQVNYTPVVDVRRCYGGAKSVAEACKYAVKPDDVINMGDWDMTVETLRTLDSALDKRRFIGLGGIIRDLHKALHLDDMDNGDLIGADGTSEDPAEDEVIFFWNGYNQYVR